MKVEPPIDYETGLKLARLKFWRKHPTGKAIADRLEAELEASGVRGMPSARRDG